MDILLETIVDDYYCNLKAITKEYYDELYDYIEEKGIGNAELDKISKELEKYHAEKGKKLADYISEISVRNILKMG